MRKVCAQWHLALTNTISSVAYGMALSACCFIKLTGNDASPHLCSSAHRYPSL